MFEGRGGSNENESGNDEILYLDDADSGEGNIYISFPSGSYTEEDAAAIAGYQALAMGLPVFWSALSLILCAVSYYLLLMRKPLRVLGNSFEKITDNNLEFTVESTGKNELAGACASMEKMRQALQENTREIVVILYGNKHIAYRNQFTEEENPLLYDLFNTDADSRKKRLGEQPGPGEDSLFYRLAHEEFKEGQLQQLRLAIREGIPENRILEFFHANVSEEEMERSRKMFYNVMMQEKQDADV